MTSSKAKAVLSVQSKSLGSTVTANLRMPPRCGTAAAGAIKARSTAARAAAKRRDRRTRRRLPQSLGPCGRPPLFGRARVRTSAGPAGLLPALELGEKVVLLLLRHRRAGGAQPLVEKALKHHPQVLGRDRLGDRGVAGEPLLGRREAPPPGKVRGEIDLVPFRLVARFEQALKLGEEGVDEIDEIVITRAADRQIGGEQNRSDRH